MSGYNDLVFYGTATSGAAGTTCVTSGTLQSGKYRATITTLTSGTVIASDANNLQLIAGGGTVAPRLMQPLLINTAYTNPPILFTVPSGGTALVTAVGSVSVNATYSTQMILAPEALW